jgi:hypothetical protein
VIKRLKNSCVTSATCRYMRETLSHEVGHAVRLMLYPKDTSDKPHTSPTPLNHHHGVLQGAAVASCCLILSFLAVSLITLVAKPRRGRCAPGLPKLTINPMLALVFMRAVWAWPRRYQNWNQRLRVLLSKHCMVSLSEKVHVLPAIVGSWAPDAPPRRIEMMRLMCICGVQGTNHGRSVWSYRRSVEQVSQDHDAAPQWCLPNLFETSSVVQWCLKPSPAVRCALKPCSVVTTLGVVIHPTVFALQFRQMCLP